MGRGRGKGKKLTVVTSHEDPGSGEETLPAYKRRGRPQKPLKDEIDEDEVEKIEEEEDGGSIKSSITMKDSKVTPVVENGKKRKKQTQLKESLDSVKDENGVGTRSSTENIKSNGFRQTGSRRKSKPRRAAEAGVECKIEAMKIRSVQGRRGSTRPVILIFATELAISASELDFLIL